MRLTALEGLTALEVAIPWARLAPLLDEPTLRAAALSAAALAGSPEAARALAEALPRARGSAFDQALRALGRLAEGRSPPASPRRSRRRPRARASASSRARSAATRGGRPVGGAAATCGPATAARGWPAEARRSASPRMAGAPGVVDAAVAALAEDLLAEPAQEALAALGASALPAIFERLADAAVPPEARAALVDVIADVLDGDSAESTRRGAVSGAPSRRSAGPRAIRSARVAVRALRALARLGDEGDLLLGAEQTLDPARPVAVAAEGARSPRSPAGFPVAARAFADRRGPDPRDESAPPPRRDRHRRPRARRPRSRSATRSSWRTPPPPATPARAEPRSRRSRRSAPRWCGSASPRPWRC